MSLSGSPGVSSGSGSALGSSLIASTAIFALLGDSITANNGSAGGSSYYNTGYATWWKILSGHRAFTPTALNLGVTGNTIAQMQPRVPTIIAAAPSFCIFMGGTNDVTGGSTFAQMSADYKTIVPVLVNAGIPVIWIPILPISGLTTAQKLVRAQANTMIREAGFGRADVLSAMGFNPGKGVLVSDPCPFLEDFTAGGPIAKYFQDGKHPNAAGAQLMGRQLHNDVSPLLAKRDTTLTDFDDYWTSVNTSGNLFFTGTTNSGLCQGTGGFLTANSGITPTGVVASNAQIFMNASSAAGVTLVGSKENPRQDGPQNGERQVVTYFASGSGGTAERATFGTVNNIGNCSTGDVVYGECSYSVDNGPVNLLSCELTMNEDSGAFSVDGQFASQSNHSGIVGHSGVLRTPPVALTSGSPSIQLFCNAYFDTTLGATGGSGTIRWGDLTLKKLIAY